LGGHEYHEPTTTENSKSKLEIVVGCFACYVSFETLLANILRVAMISTTYVSDILLSIFWGSYGWKWYVGHHEFHEPTTTENSKSKLEIDVSCFT
jgi:hypothetical protein